MPTLARPGSRDWRFRLTDPCPCGHSRGDHNTTDGCCAFAPSGRPCTCPRFRGHADDLGVFLRAASWRLRRGRILPEAYPPGTFSPATAAADAIDGFNLAKQPVISASACARLRRQVSADAAALWAPSVARATADSMSEPADGTLRELADALQGTAPDKAIEQVAGACAGYPILIHRSGACVGFEIIADVGRDRRCAWTLRRIGEAVTGDWFSAAEILCWHAHVTDGPDVVVDVCAQLSATGW